MPIRVFISHCSADADFAKALIKLVQKALVIEPDEIRCTSVDGHRLPVGAHVNDALRDEVIESTALVALLTPVSLESTFVLFELGARWGVQRPLFPLLGKGTSGRQLEGPLKSINALECGSNAQVHQFLDDLAAALAVKKRDARYFSEEIDAFTIAAAGSPGHESSAVAKPATPKVTAVGAASVSRGHADFSFQEISERIANAPPLQEAEIAKTFEGYWVDWEAYLADAWVGLGPSGQTVMKLRPWEPNSLVRSINAPLPAERLEPFRDRPKDTPVRVKGRIRSAAQFDVWLDEVELTLLKPEEARGTRPRMLVPDIRAQLGRDVSAKLTNQTIKDQIRAQVRMGNPPGLSLVNNGVIVPELEERSKNFKLLVLHTAKQIIEGSTGLPASERRDRLFRLEDEIHKIENGSGFGW